MMTAGARTGGLMTYRDRLLNWMHEQNIVYEKKVTYTSIAKKAGVSVATVQRIARGKRTFRGDVLEKVGVALSGSPDFFFRETDPTAPITEPAPTPGRCAFTSVDDAKRILSRFYESIGPDHCRTFTIICDCRNGRGARVLAVVDGEVVYVGPDRHRGNSA